MAPRILEKTYPLSHAQSRELITEMTWPGTTFASLPYRVVIGDVDFVTLERAINRIIAAHDALRIRLTRVEMEHVQYVAEPRERHFDFQDFSSDFGRDRQQVWLSSVIATPFELFDSDLFYFALVRFADGRGGFFVNAHHLIADGASMKLVIDEIVVTYRDLLAGTSDDAPAPPSFLEALQSETEYLGSAQYLADQAYWKERFAELPEEVLLPYNKSNRYGVEAEAREFDLAADLARDVVAFCARSGASFYRVFSAVMLAYVARVTSLREVTVGVLTHNRMNAREKRMVGMFVNTVPLRVPVDLSEDFSTFLKSMSTNMIDTVKGHAHYPFDSMARDLRDAHGTAPNLLNLVLVAEDFSSEHAEVTFCHPGAEQPPYHLVVFVTTKGGREKQFSVQLAHPKGSMDADDVERMVGHLFAMLGDAVRHPERRLSALEMLGEAERNILAGFNATHTEVDAGKTFIERFEAQVATRPRHPAVVYGEARLTYAELDSRANRLARRLRALGARPDDLVALVTEPSLEMIVGMLGILKAGAGYLPIDSKYLADRVQFMLEDSQARILLTQRQLRDRVSSFTGTVLILEDDESYSDDGSALEVAHGPQNLAYVIYTSGSTGQPKGVLIEHRALFNLLTWFIRAWEVTPADVCAQFSSIGFDASIIEIYPALAAGATLHVLPGDVKLSLHHLNEYMEAQGVSVIFQTTQYAEHFMAQVDNRSLRVLLTGGDRLKRPVRRRYRLLNGYGPTEFTVFATTREVVGDDFDSSDIPIGRPLDNSSAYVVDAAFNLQPVGAPGELCLAGSQIARGYLGRPQLTAEKFVDNPFRPGEKMYRTGDRVRWRKDGNLEFLGRIDFQVKIRGFRIEMGDIEQHMLSFVGVEEAIVVAREDDSGDKTLCGYFVAHHAIRPSDFAAYLGQKLPAYMVPPFLIQLDQMPLNASGKIDRKALPAPQLDTACVAAENSLEEKLVELWKAIFERERIGVTDDFFQLGGHSLTAVLLQSQIQDQLGVEISFQDIFKAPTIRELAVIIRKTAKVALAEIPPLPARQYYPATSAQRRLYFLEQMRNIGTTYNCPFLFELEGALDEGRLSAALDAVIARHEALRTSFEVVDGEPVQVVHETVRYKKNYLSVEESQLDALVADFIQPFDLRVPPLFRLQLLRLGPERHCLLFDAHHTVFDGTSLTVFVNDLMACYRGESLPALRIQYRDFAAWHNRLQRSDVLAGQEEFWLKMYPSAPPVAELCTDFPRPPFLDYAGGRTSRYLDPQIVDGMKLLASGHGCTLNMVVMAAFYAMLARYTGQSDIVIGTGIAGRNQLDTRRLVGMFVNTLPIRTCPDDDKTFLQFLAEVRETFIAAFENQDYQFENLVEKINIKRDPSRNPMFDVGFVYQSMGFPSLEAERLRIRSRDVSRKTSVFDIMLEVVEDDDGLALNWSYRTSLFRADTIGRMAGHLENLMRSAVTGPEKKIQDLEMLAEAEKRQLLEAWNDTEADFPRDKTVHALFEEIVARFPHRVAVSCEMVHLTYAELNCRANQLAHKLRAKGIKPDTLVGILLDRRVEMLVGLMAVLKAGGGYLPILDEYPADRIQYMLENSGAPILLTSPAFFEKVAGYSGEIINILDQTLFEGDDSNPVHVNSPRDLIYVIYTSGSTGKPKGVMLEHHNVVRLFLNDRFQYAVDERDVWSMFHSFSFDFSVWEVYGALLYGGRVAMVPHRVAMDPRLFVEFCKDQKVTVLSQTPGAFYNFIAEDLKTDDHHLAIRYVTFGGEALKPALLDKWHRKYPDARLINMYGITETTVHVTFKQITDEDIEHNVSNIGGPIPTLTTYLMDRHLRLVPIGVAGEIEVGGEGVARGYIGLPERTKERFIENPHRPGERLYRSGDLARRLATGEMEYLGRIDFQVKIRGFRVELAEIENRLLTCSGIDKSVVLALDDASHSKFLAAYFTASRPMDSHELREHIKKELPEYMVPSYFVQLDAFPLTSNGKIDRNALPSPEAQVQTRESVASHNEAERVMLGVWRRVLGLQDIGVTDDFFDLGGHSMKAVMLVSELRTWFDVTVNDVFEHPTVEGLAAAVPMKEIGLEHRLVEITQHVEAQQARKKTYLESAAGRARVEAYERRNAEGLELDYTAKRNYQTILLTGAAGHLGVYLLRELLEAGGASVVAIVRGADSDEAQRRLRETCNEYFGPDFFARYHPHRLRVLRGELSAVKLGLSDAEYDELAQSVDAILHPAALIKHYGHYQTFYDSNVLAPMRLIELAKTGRKKDIHHISTLSVAFGAVKGADHILFTEDDSDLGQQSDNYYVKTKMEAEQKIIEARESGIVANIYRVGNIAIHSKTGHLQQNIGENAFYQQVKAFLNLGVVPETEDEVEFSFADQLGRAIVLLLDCRSLVNQNFHLWNSHVEKLSDILTAPELGLNLRRCSFADFVEFMGEHHDVPGFREHIEAVMLHRGWLNETRDPTAGSAEDGATILSERTNQVLGRLGFEWPVLDKRVLRPLVMSALAERIAFLQTTPLFRHLDSADVEAVAALANPQHVQEGRSLLWEGESSNFFYVVESGALELSRTSPLGWIGTILVARRGDCIGENTLIDGRVSPINAEALRKDLRVLAYRGADLRAMLAHCPALGLGFVDALGEHIRRLETLVVSDG